MCNSQQNNLHRALDHLNEKAFESASEGRTSNTSAQSFAGVPSIKVDERERLKEREREREAGRDGGKDPSRLDGGRGGGYAGVRAGEGAASGAGVHAERRKEGQDEASGKRLHRRPSTGGDGGVAASGSDGLVGIGALLKPNSKGMFKVGLCCRC
jgi:hypothetical protein